MTTKVKFIIAAAIIVATIISALILYIYIDHLNDKISALSNIVDEQASQIVVLNANVEALKKSVNAFNETINITSSYIDEIKQINYGEDIVKQAILNEVIDNENTEVLDWYNEALPDSLVNILNDAYESQCANGI